ncbi:MAG: HD domain-containing protein [Firmicutes bacterium]|nr:HD domain-containing protein [Bacillota bacterium]
MEPIRKAVSGTVRPRRLWTAGLVLLTCLAPFLAFEYLQRRPDLDPLIPASLYHFVIVSVTSLAAGGVATAVGMAARRQRNLQIMLLALGFMSLGFMFALHGLATPGFLLEANALPGASSSVSLLLTALWMALSSASTSSPLLQQLSAARAWLVPAWAGVLVVTVAASLGWPHLWDAVPLAQPRFQWAVAVATIGLLAASGNRYWRTYVATGLHFPLAVVFASGWLAVAEWIIVRGELWRVSWWSYHYLLLAAVGVMSWGVLRLYSQGGTLAEAVYELFRSDPLRQLDTGLAGSVRALVVATEVRDPYTAGHSYRVAQAALQLGEAMGLSSDQLVALVHGGLVHDVGKLKVPDHILNKPGPLTPEEQKIIEEHPVAGYEMCSRLGFLPDELAIIRHHHERWDGTGYPDGLRGRQIPLLARILAIADVYDALTSRRAYREPWSHQQAREYILRNAGTQFDPECVAIWARLTTDGPTGQARRLTGPAAWLRELPQR